MPNMISFDSMTTLAAGAMLLQWWMPILFLIPLAGWAWVVSTIFDKDAARFHLKREQYNILHMGAALIATAVLFLAPLPFLITFPIAAGLLAAHLLIYMQMRNASDRVPAGSKWSMNPSVWFEKASEGKKKKGKDPKLAKGISMFFKGPGGVAEPPEAGSPEFEVRLAAEDLLSQAVDRRSPVMELAPLNESAYAATCMVDGVRTAISQVPAPKAIAIINFYKAIAGFDLEDRRRRNITDIAFGIGGPGKTPLRVSTQGSSKGMRLSLYVDPAQQVDRRIDTLGLFEKQMADLRTIIEEAKGVVLLAAPVHNGRTSTLYALLRAHDAYTSNVQVIELEQSATIEGVRHTVWDSNSGGEFATTVRSILRRDPDVVGIAEMYDEETAKVVARADHDHSRVYLSVRAPDVFEAIQIYSRAVGDANLAANSLHGVIGTRLLRKLSPNAKIPYTPAPDVLKKLGLPPEVKTLYRTEGTVMMKDKAEADPLSQGTGYFGQIAAFAVHPFSEEDRRLIATNELGALRAAFRQRKQHSLTSAAMQLVVQGETSVEEVARVFQGGGQKQARKPSSTPASA
ncbi:MAG: Flp pilus assembly complex ATPase component TadA [Phycisphaerales bacterium]|nr:Flp pilus assembly complex ATPase component TadA [Phycisphaerales bacterium]